MREREQLFNEWKSENQSVKKDVEVNKERDTSREKVRKESAESKVPKKSKTEQVCNCAQTKILELNSN